MPGRFYCLRNDELSPTLSETLDLLARPAYQERLRGCMHGIEKESLRISADGALARTPHPPALGSALTHPTITTDYSEALLELITPVSTSIDGLFDSLDRIHRFTYAQLGDERLWTCLLYTSPSPRDRQKSRMPSSA